MLGGRSDDCPLRLQALLPASSKRVLGLDAVLFLLVHHDDLYLAAFHADLPNSHFLCGTTRIAVLLGT